MFGCDCGDLQDQLEQCKEEVSKLTAELEETNHRLEEVTQLEDEIVSYQEVVIALLFEAYVKEFPVLQELSHRTLIEIAEELAWYSSKPTLDYVIKLTVSIALDRWVDIGDAKYLRSANSLKELETKLNELVGISEIDQD